MDDLISRQAAIDAVNKAYDRETILAGFLRSIAIRAIGNTPSAQPEQQWIPCSERLPKYGKSVLTQLDCGYMEVNWIIDDEEGEWFTDGAVAWMPLPEPYKGETDDPEG